MGKRIVGVDIRSTYCQYCFYDETKQDALNVQLGTEEEALCLGTQLFYMPEDKSWHFGTEAQELAKTKQGQYFENILEHLPEEEPVVLGDNKVTWQELFGKLLQMHLEFCFGKHVQLEKLVVTAQCPTVALRQAVWQAAERFALSQENVSLVSYSVAALHYIFQQDLSIWNHSVALFEYDAQQLFVTRFQIERYKRPMQVTITRKRLEAMPCRRKETQNQELEQAFLTICRDVFSGRNQNVSGIYLLGEGFSGDWILECAKTLCRGRRVFIGENLYAKGACFAAENGTDTREGKQGITVYAPGMVHWDAGIKVWYHGTKQMVPIALGEKEWFNIRGEVCVILDEETQLEIDIVNRQTKHVTRELIQMQGLPKRPPKTTKLCISVRYLDQTHGEICIRDMGFGTMYPSSGKVYRREFQLPEE